MTIYLTFLVYDLESFQDYWPIILQSIFSLGCICILLTFGAGRCVFVKNARVVAKCPFHHSASAVTGTHATGFVKAAFVGFSSVKLLLSLTCCILWSESLSQAHLGVEMLNGHMPGGERLSSASEEWGIYAYCLEFFCEKDLSLLFSFTNSIIFISLDSYILILLCGL